MPATRLEILRHMAETNGLRWTAYALFYALGRGVVKDLRIPRLDKWMRDLEDRTDSPGMGEARLQSLIWESWDWDRELGEEWTESEEWRQSVIDHVLLPRVQEGGCVLEVGPGAGRWTETLVAVAGSLVLVDISERCISICRDRFGHIGTVSFYVTQGSDLAVVSDESIDTVWSFDVFVHIHGADIARYVEEFSRVLKPGGRAVIHHADENGLRGGWRSAMTAKEFRRLAEVSGLEVEEQFNSWGKTEVFDVRYYGDVISVLRKPQRDRSKRAAVEEVG